MFRRIFNTLRGIHPPPLGRWCLKDKSKNNWKIDTANTDHCGTCSYENKKPSTIVNIEEIPTKPKKNEE
jgi:hypothetical protein